MRVLTPDELELIDTCRRAVLGTIAPDGRPRLVPLAFAAALSEEHVVIYAALDEKPKSVADPRALARVRDIINRPRVSLLLDRWSEDWSELRWLRLDGQATLVEPTDDPTAEHPLAIGLLRARYPPYRHQQLEARPALRIEVERAVGWSAGDR